MAEGLVRQGIYRPVAFIDTDYTLVGRKVAGLKVYSTEEIGTVLTYYDPKEVMVAKAQTDRRSRRALVDMFVQAGLQVKIIPDLQELADGRIELSALRPIRVEDLLGRDPVPADRILMEKAVKGRVIMVTGAGGSIGSELVRQAASFAPTKIVMVDNNEFALFEINRDMEAKRQGDKNFGLKLVPVLADVVDIDRMEVIIFEHKVEVVLHAAAYKHVRMVQENILAGIRNNVVGTKQLAEAAMRQKVSLFILISTDKAVRPTSIMGATKRISEMIIQALSRHKDNKTVFTMVRFGNVLGSTGSVVPLFREQISRGGPVLVTHPDVTRFFMLIPEAAQLVIQAGAMGTGGDVFVLDMGESVKIIDLAHTMIELAGLSPKTEQNPEGDIEVKFIGLQEGEKLFEELQIGRDVSKTPHPRIMRTNEFYLPWTKLDRRLTALKQSLDKNDPKRAVMDVMELARMEE